jgi:ribosomal protein L13E
MEKEKITERFLKSLLRRLKSFPRWLRTFLGLEGKELTGRKSENRIKPPQNFPIEQVPPVTEHSESESSVNTQEASTEESKQHGKPYEKKAPTGKRSSSSPPRWPTTGLSRRNKSSYLGGIRRRRNIISSTNMPKPQGSGTNEAEQTSDAEENLNIQSPFIEISLNGVIVNLVFPEQVIRIDGEDQPAQLLYHVEFNRELREITTSVRQTDASTAVVQRTEMLLNDPPKTLNISYPDLLNKKTFEYNHVDTSLYLFRAIGNDRGRMFWLFDEAGHPNPLPKRCFWLLLHEDYELEQPSPVLIDEQWVWNHYKPCLIDLGQANVLKIRHKTSSRSLALGAERSFQIESEKLIEDDFRNQSPLFSGRTINVIAPHTNEQGWTVWLSSKEHPAQLLRTDWTGEAPTILDCPDHLPAPFGEFHIDICPTGSRIAEETLFFRWFPWLVIDHKRDLVFPDSHKGHSAAEIRIQLQELDRWKISNDKNYPVRSTGSEYLLDFPPDTDTVRMTIKQRSSLEPTMTIKLTAPRVKWRTSDSLVWHSGISRMKRDQLITGSQVNLIVRTNDLFKEHDLTAVLQTGNKQLQTERMRKNGLDYVIALNKFFDTIAGNLDELCISVEVRDNDDKRLMGTIQTVVFPKKRTEEQIKSQKTDLVQAFQAKVMSARNTNKRRLGRGFSRKEVTSAGLDFSAIRRSKQISLDKRRKSCHQWNVETLLAIKANQTPV